MSNTCNGGMILESRKVRGTMRREPNKREDCSPVEEQNVKRINVS
jgi:hypothetical protein